MTENQEARQDELVALESIYGEDLQREESADGAEIRVCVQVPPDYKVRARTGEIYTEYVVSSLPPLVLAFNLPVSYPTEAAPLFRLNCTWLSASQLAVVHQHLVDLWREGQGNVVLFSWIQFLKEDLISFLQIQSLLEVDGATPCHGRNDEAKIEDSVKEAEFLDQASGQEEGPQASLLLEILEYDEAQKQKAFDGQMFVCGICFTEKLGSDCMRFQDCDHVCCRTCLTQFFTVSIREGRVQELRCPEPGCSVSATPSQVKHLVSKDLFIHYDKLLLQASLDRMTDIVYCPRQSCSSPVVLEPDGKAAICPACAYAFCSLCKRGYHGALNCMQEDAKKPNEDDTLAYLPMKQEAIQALFDDYHTGSAERRKLLNKRYGKHVLKTQASDLLSQTWVDQNTKQCPNCARNIEKNGGCNMMLCSACGKYFCWNCMALLQYGTSRCLC